MQQLKIAKIEKISAPLTRYDIQVENTNNLFANDILVHNCRCMSIVYPDGTVNQYSRNGKEFTNFDIIKNQLSKHAVFFKEAMVLDGEVMSKSFQDLMKQARRKTEVQADDAMLNLFDIVSLNDFNHGVANKPQHERSKELIRWHSLIADHMPNVTVLGHELVDLDTTEGIRRLYEINTKALEVKAEGIMIKDPFAPYECKRSTNWLKMKPFIEETLAVTGCEEGKPDSKFVGTLGALICEGVVDGKNVKVNVGGGYSIKLRAQLWASYTGKPVTWQKKEGGKWVVYTEQPEVNPIGLLAEIRADALTKSQDSEVWSMRFPRFKTFRGSKAGEKV